MIVLASTSDIIRVVTSGSATIEVHASWVDWNGTTSTPDSTNTAISSGTTTTVVAAPASSTQRNIKHLTVFNTDASASNTITIEMYDGSTGSNLWKGTLAAGESVAYNG